MLEDYCRSYNKRPVTDVFRTKIRFSKCVGGSACCPLFTNTPWARSMTVIYLIYLGAASQAGDADSSRAPGLTSGLQGSVNIHRGALLLVLQCQCISSFVFYIMINSVVNIRNCLRFH